jgi:hypothetical protein
MLTPLEPNYGGNVFLSHSDQDHFVRGPVHDLPLGRPLGIHFVAYNDSSHPWMQTPNLSILKDLAPL